VRVIYDSVQHPVRDRDVRPLLEDGPVAHLVAFVPRLLVLQHQPAGADLLLPGQPHLLVGGPHPVHHLHRLRGLHEVERPGGDVRQEDDYQKQGDSRQKYRSTYASSK